MAISWAPHIFLFWATQEVDSWGIKTPRIFPVLSLNGNLLTETRWVFCAMESFYWYLILLSFSFHVSLSIFSLSKKNCEGLCGGTNGRTFSLHALTKVGRSLRIYTNLQTLANLFVVKDFLSRLLHGLWQNNSMLNKQFEICSMVFLSITSAISCLDWSRLDPEQFVSRFSWI